MEKQEEQKRHSEEKEKEEEEEEEQEDATNSNNCYPNLVGEADYEQLVQNADFFMLKLKDFHSSLGTNFISPSLGGATLDLHRLFVEVTSRGGLDKVIKDRKWEEVVSAFQLGTTNFKRSFLLRKYYMSLLYHFEQAYFFKRKAPAVAINDATKQITVIGTSMESPPTFSEEPSTTSHLQASVQLQPGASLIGVIDEKLDNGYVVTVNLGYDTLKGILYHIPDKPPPFWSPDHTPKKRKRKKSQLSLVEYTSLNPATEGQGISVSNVGEKSNQLSEPEKQLNQDREAMVEESEHTEVVDAAMAP